VEKHDSTFGCYILEGKTFRKARSMAEWAEFMNIDGKPLHYRTVANDEYVVNGKYFCSLSTVFLGVDHNYNMYVHTPILFESMIFDGEHLNEEMQRYTTYVEASAGHMELRGRVFNMVNRRFKIETMEPEYKSSKHTIFRLDSKIKSYTAFNENDIRLIREN